MFEVKLHVYDLSNGMAAQFSRQLIGKQIEGIWHTGIVIYGKEFYFGGGISYDPPGRTPFGRPTKELDLGFTEITEDLFMEFLKEISPRFTQETYNVFKHNCNNFTNECAQFLMGSDIPGDIINLPGEFLNTPIGRMISPMIEQMQDNLKVNSHQVFNNSGQQNPLQNAGGGGFGSNPMGQGFGNANPTSQMNNFINQFASGMNMGGGQMPNYQVPSQQQQQVHNTGGSYGGVIQIQNLQQLQQLIKDTPALAVDFWSPSCPPCMRIKPFFESLCKSNDNENLKFAAVNTQTCRDCAMAFKITSIPQFYFYVNGKEHAQFKGARDDMLVSTLTEISELVKTKSSSHKNLNYKQFKPMNLAPQGFTSMNLIDKMKEFVLNFTKSEEVQKEVKSTQNMQKWLSSFKLESIPREAIDELIEMIDVAEDKNKIALIDLLRLLMMYEHSAAHILNKHWQCFEVSIFGYMQCMDIKDPEQKVIQNYHLICLKMLGNIYQTESGKEFLQGEDASTTLINFCTFSFDSVNPKVVFTAAIVLFNHVLCFKRDKSLLQNSLEQTIKKINQIITDPLLTDMEALMGLLLCECRVLYQNKQICEFIQKQLDTDFKKNHLTLKQKTQHIKVKEAVDDVLMMLFD